MIREEQIKNMARAIHLNCHKGLTSTEAEMIAKWCYQEIDRVSLENAREIFADFESILFSLMYLDFDGKYHLRKMNGDRVTKIFERYYKIKNTYMESEDTE